MHPPAPVALVLRAKMIKLCVLALHAEETHAQDDAPLLDFAGGDRGRGGPDEQLPTPGVAAVHGDNGGSAGPEHHGLTRGGGRPQPQALEDEENVRRRRQPGCTRGHQRGESGADRPTPRHAALRPLCQPLPLRVRRQPLSLQYLLKKAVHGGGTKDAGRSEAANDAAKWLTGRMEELARSIADGAVACEDTFLTMAFENEKLEDFDLF